MKRRKLLNLRIIILFLALNTVAISQAKPLASAGNVTLSINARNDKPQPVQINIQGWDIHGNPIIDEIMGWDSDDNSFSTKTIEISKKTRVLRFTFVNDYYVPGNPDTDRNAYIDYFMVNNLRYEAEKWGSTGGPDPLYPGAEVDTVDGRVVADCGNQGDWVEFELHPGNSVGPGNGPGKRVGPKP